MNPITESFNIEILDSPSGARILRLTGPLTIRTLFDLQSVSRAEAGKPIIMDVSGVPYMDSAGLGTVVSTYTSCQTHNKSFAICGLSGRIKTLFEVTHVDGLLPCFDSMEAAEAAASAAKS